MERYIALLRGINVGGKRIIKMDDLKTVLSSIGLKNIITYIQSGNIIFDCPKSNIQVLEEKMKKEIFKSFGFEVPVIIRTHEEYIALTDRNPFFNAESDTSKLVITFLQQKPNAEDIRITEKLDFPPDKFQIKGKEVFIYCESKYHLTKISNSFFEKKLNTHATSRNWKTLNKILQMIKSK
ncbi:MAG: DUF1697 domain-containing protein [Clostridia bacterium]|nr:DUF1697 domain-containing protein [Clostridia bacterium]